MMPTHRWVFHFKSSCSQMFYIIGVLKNFAKFTGKHLCWSLLIKLQACEIFKRTFFHRTLPVTAFVIFFFWLQITHWSHFDTRKVVFGHRFCKGKWVIYWKTFLFEKKPFVSSPDSFQITFTQFCASFVLIWNLH